MDENKMPWMNDNYSHLENADDMDSFYENAAAAKKLVLDVQEDERQRIARDLHDYSLQNLTHMIHKAELCSMYMDKDMLQAKLELAGISKGLKNVIEEIRDIIYNLRPMAFDDLGIEEAFERLRGKLEEDSGIKVKLQIRNQFCSDNIILLTMYRIVRECAWNAVKHSGGSELFIQLEDVYEEAYHKYFFYISVEDNGKGFDVQGVQETETGHYGLSMIKERVLLLSGTIKIDSNNCGTRIFVKVPFTRNDKAGEKE